MSLFRAGNLTPLVGLHTLDSVLQQEVAVISKDRTTGVVQLVGLGGWLENLAKKNMRVTKR